MYNSANMMNNMTCQNGIINPFGMNNATTFNNSMVNTGCQNGISILNPQINPNENNNDDEEIIKNIEKIAIERFPSQDITLLSTNEGLYVIVNNSINNKNYIKNFLKCTFLNCPYKEIKEHIFWFQGLQFTSIPPSMDKIIKYAYHIGEEFIFLTFKKGDFISLNTGQILLINLDSILKKIKVDGVTLDFLSPLNLPLFQNLQVSLNTDKELFLDGKATYKKEELSCLKTIQEKIEIIKRGKNNG